MSILAFNITKGQVVNLTVVPEDAADNPGILPGPVAWALNDPTLGTITPSTDAFVLNCQFVPAAGKSGIAKVVASDPAAPSIPAVEADITFSPLAPATHLVMTGQVG